MFDKGIILQTIKQKIRDKGQVVGNPSVSLLSVRP